MSDSLQPHGPQHARLPCPSPSPRVCSNSCPLSQWPSNHLIVCCPLLLLPSIFPSIRVFSSESALGIRWAKYWSFSFRLSLSNEYSQLVSFRIDWFDLLLVRGTLKSSPTPQFESINSSALSLPYSPQSYFQIMSHLKILRGWNFNIYFWRTQLNSLKGEKSRGVGC